jgi:hypothetical protein
MGNDPLSLGLLLAALALATVLYALLLRRRHATDRWRDNTFSSIADNYGRSGLP